MYNSFRDVDSRGLVPCINFNFQLIQRKGNVKGLSWFEIIGYAYTSRFISRVQVLTKMLSVSFP